MSGIETFLLPLSLPFMQQAYLMALIVAVPAALLSCFLVLKGWALMGDAISHAVLPGIVLAYMAGLPLAMGAFTAGMACALLTGFLKENSRLREDTIMGVVFSGMFAIGLVMFTAIRTDIHLDHILLGDLLGVNWRDILETGFIALVVSGAILVKRNDLLLHAFDPQQARASGLPVRLLHYGLLAMLALTIVAALQAVGIILSVAFLIGPGATAFLLARRFPSMLAIAVATSLSSSLAGVHLSFFLDSAPAPTIVVILSLIFASVFTLTSLRTAIAVRRGALR